MKNFVVLVTGGEYFLTPCVVIQAPDEETARAQIKANNRDYRRYSIALDKINSTEVAQYKEQGAHVAETPEDIAHAF